MVCLLAAPWVQLSVSVGNGWPHNVLRHHWLMPISCHFRDCKALLVTSLTHVNGDIASVQTFTFTYSGTYDLCISAIFSKTCFLDIVPLCCKPSISPTKIRWRHSLTASHVALSRIMCIIWYSSHIIQLFVCLQYDTDIWQHLHLNSTYYITIQLDHHNPKYLLLISLTFCAK